MDWATEIWLGYHTLALADKNVGKAASDYVIRLPKIKFNTANGNHSTAKGLRAYVSLLGGAESSPI